jgi:hypothetical protein
LTDDPEIDASEISIDVTSQVVKLTEPSMTAP